jgi:hypothetical protein
VEGALTTLLMSLPQLKGRVVNILAGNGQYKDDGEYYTVAITTFQRRPLEDEGYKLYLEKRAA